MFWLLLLMALPALLTAQDPIRVYRQPDSSVLFPVTDACTASGSFHFDLSGSKHMGSYHGDLQGRNGYEDRVKYDKDTCTIILENLEEKDGRTFTVDFKRVENGKPVPHTINYIIDDPLTSRPYTEVKAPTQANPLTSRPYTEVKAPTQAGPVIQNVTRDSGHLSFASFCLSLDSAVNVLVALCVWLIPKCCNKLKKERVKSGAYIIGYCPIASEIGSVITMCIARRSCPWPLIPVPAILITGCLLPCVLPALSVTCFMDRCPCLCCSDNMQSICKKMALIVWRVVWFLIPALFPVCVGLIHYKSDDDIARQESPSFGYVVLSLVVSLVLRIGVLTVTYCYQRIRMKFTPVPTEETKSAPDAPEEVKEAAV